MALEGDSVDQAVGPDGQSGSIARRVEVADCRTHTHAAVDVEGEGPYARGARSIVVRAVGEPGVAACPIEGALLRPPFVGPIPAADDGSVQPMKLVREVLVRFQLSQVRQDLFEPPLGVAPLRPPIEVLRHSPEKLGVVDGAGAARDPASRDIYLGLVRGPGAKTPHVFAVPGSRPGPVGVPHQIGHSLRRGIVCSGLQKQDGPAVVFRQTGRQDRTCRTRPDDNVIVSFIHAASPSCSTFPARPDGKRCNPTTSVPLPHRVSGEGRIPLAGRFRTRSGYRPRGLTAPNPVRNRLCSTAAELCLAVLFVQPGVYLNSKLQSRLQQTVRHLGLTHKLDQEPMHLPGFVCVRSYHIFQLFRI